MQSVANQASTTNWTHAVSSRFKKQTKLFLNDEFWWHVVQKSQLQTNTTCNAAQFRKIQQANCFISDPSSFATYVLQVAWSSQSLYFKAGLIDWSFIFGLKSSRCCFVHCETNWWFPESSMHWSRNIMMFFTDIIQKNFENKSHILTPPTMSFHHWCFEYTEFSWLIGCWNQHFVFFILDFLHVLRSSPWWICCWIPLL